MGGKRETHLGKLSTLSDNKPKVVKSEIQKLESTQSFGDVKAGNSIKLTKYIQLDGVKSLAKKLALRGALRRQGSMTYTFLDAKI